MIIISSEVYIIIIIIETPYHLLLLLIIVYLDGDGIHATSACAVPLELGMKAFVQYIPHSHKHSYIVREGLNFQARPLQLAPRAIILSQRSYMHAPRDKERGYVLTHYKRGKAHLPC